MDIQCLTPEDVDPFLEALWIPAQRELSTHTPYTLCEDIREDGHTYRQSLLEDDDARTLVARSPDTWIGFLTAMIETPPPIFEQDPACRVDEVYVAPAHRRRGVATALLEAVEEWARTRDCVALTLVVPAGNDAATAVYDAYGFDVAEHNMHYQLEA
ncbi:MAG: GNAT family N-acetyltransferase [Halobacteriaceae archaeon]